MSILKKNWNWDRFHLLTIRKKNRDRSMSKRYWYIIIFATHAALSPLSAGEGSFSIEEAIFLKRLSSIWQDGEYATVQEQILDYLFIHHRSPIEPHLLIMLGDLYFHENQYALALETYERIQDKKFQDKTLLNRLQAFFELGEYSRVINTSLKFYKKDLPLHRKQGPKFRFLFAESLYRLSETTANPELQIKLIQKAKPHYVRLLQSEYADLSLLALAEVHRTLGEHEDAAEAYLTLAEKFPEKREDLLFTAAAMQAHYDLIAAAETSKRVYLLEGEKSSIAAYNQMVFLFQAGEFEKLLEAQDTTWMLLSKKDSSPLHFLIGKAHHALGHYPEAARSLQLYLRADKSSSFESKAALLTLVECSQKLGDLPLFSAALSRFNKAFPQDPDYVHLRLLHAELAANQGKLDMALSDIHELLAQNPDLIDYEFLFYQMAQLTKRQEHWESARIGFLSYLKQFPEGKFQKEALRQQITCSRHYFQQEPGEKSRKLLITDLEQLLAKPEALDEQELQLCRLDQIHILYEERNYPLLIAKSEQYLMDYPNSSGLSELHLMLAIAHETNKGLFFFYAEKALLDPQLKNRAIIYLKLFNMHLSDQNVEMAAESLYQAYKLDLSITTQNQIWLSTYYYKEAKLKGDPIAFERAQDLLEDLVVPDGGPLSVQRGNFLLEAEVMKLSSLLSLDYIQKSSSATPEVKEEGKKSLLASLQLLEDLHALQQKRPDLGWDFQRHTLFELAAIHQYGPSYLSKASILKKLRLEFAHLPKNERIEGNEVVHTILNELKDLQVRKRIETEPIHLEAGLEYVKIRTSLLPRRLQPEKRRRLLDNLKREFLADYQGQENRLLQIYMRYIDAEIAHLEAFQEKEEEKSFALLMRAKNDLRNLLTEAEKTAPELFPHIQDSLEKIGIQ